MSNIIKPFHYQQTCIDFIKTNHGLLLYHYMGSGKTITSLLMANQFNKDIVVIATKSSKKNFEDDIVKLALSKENITIFSFKKAVNFLLENLNYLSNKILIIDEAHHLRNQTKQMSIIISASSLAYKIILLSATPVINHMSDISVLVNMVHNKHILEDDERLFNFYYYNEYEMKLANIEDLKTSLKNSISYYKQINNDDYPTSEISLIDVVMSKEQLAKYMAYIKKYIYLNVDITTSSTNNLNDNDLNIDFDSLDKRKKNFFLSATRQISNTVDNSSESPKITEIYNTIIHNNYPAIVFSNFLKNGVFPLAKLLKKFNISFAIYHGATSDEKRKKIIDQYNNQQINVLLISSAGGESLDLKRTQQLHIMEPHWNEAKINQIIGRAVRYKSHSMLPKKERHVKIFRWISVFPKKLKHVLSADQYLYNISMRKKEIFDQFDEIIKSVSIT
jgi:superfamily II DNA or RNA helicase